MLVLGKFHWMSLWTRNGAKFFIGPSSRIHGSANCTSTPRSVHLLPLSTQPHASKLCSQSYPHFFVSYEGFQPMNPPIAFLSDCALPGHAPGNQHLNGPQRIGGGVPLRRHLAHVRVSIRSCSPEGMDTGIHNYLVRVLQNPMPCARALC